MTDQPPPTLNYQRPPQPGEPRHRGAKKFFLALMVGTAVSAVIWFGGWKPLVDQGSGAALFVVPGVKVVVAVALLFWPRWKAFGLGLLVSIPIGGLVFCGACFANFRLR